MAARTLTPLLALPIAIAASLTPTGSQTRTASATLVGRVVGVTDGDTLRLRVEGRPELRVRLAEIDAPENGQPYGREAKQRLSSLAFGRRAIGRINAYDRYGRAVARLTVDGRDVSYEMVRRGAAWAYRQYLSDQRIAIAEAAARRERLGLWALQADQTTPPWQWRSSKRASASAARTHTSSRVPAAPTAVPACGSKRLCRQMTSCAEAVHYYRQCGVSRLDRDHDGKPCESLCG